MRDFYPVAGFLQTLGDVFGDHDGAVLAPGTAERDCQITFSFMNVVWQKVNQEIRDALNKFKRLRERTDVLCDFGIASSERAELRDKMGVGQKAYVKDQVGILGHAMPESEADAGNQNISAFFLLLQELDDVRTQLVDIEF